MDDAAKNIKDAAKKVSNFFKSAAQPKKFHGTGRKLGSAEPAQVCNLMFSLGSHARSYARLSQRIVCWITTKWLLASFQDPRAQMATPSVPRSKAQNSYATQHVGSTVTTLGIRDTLPRVGGGLPTAPPLEPEPQVTDGIQVASAMLLSSGEAGTEAARTICSIINNVLKNPLEQKYRQLKR
jgi:hypothetical protein